MKTAPSRSTRALRASNEDLRERATRMVRHARASGHPLSTERSVAVTACPAPPAVMTGSPACSGDDGIRAGMYVNCGRTGQADRQASSAPASRGRERAHCPRRSAPTSRTTLRSVVHEIERLADIDAGGEQAVVFHDQALVVAEIGDDTFAFVEIARHSLELMIADALVIAHGALIEGQQPAVERRQRLAGHSVGVDDGVQVLARHVNGAVADEAGAGHLVGRVVENVAIDVDLDQARGGDL